FRRTASFGVPSDLPVFVVGMPRSGTTLCEQILASHSQVFGADELPDIPRLVQDLQFERRVDRRDVDTVPFADGLAAERVRELADRHLARLQYMSPRARRVVDKMPGNYHHLGFIATLFPRAKIIHCRRDPLDTCLSCFGQDFGSLPIWTND